MSMTTTAFPLRAGNIGIRLSRETMKFVPVGVSPW